jgi:hypothetical protein
MPSQSEIARDWKVSREYVHQCVKKGCPTDSLENARNWRNCCATSRAPTNPKQIARLLEEGNDDAMKADPPSKKYSKHKPSVTRLPSIDSHRDTLDAAIEASEVAFRLLQEAIVEAKGLKTAMLVRLEAETRYREELERREVS